ncbi:MAG: hypothetical protein RR565_09755 [Erysipelothrix sp.]
MDANEKRVYVSGINMKLYKMHYNMLEESDESLNVSVNQNAVVSKVDKSSFSIIATRTIKLEPAKIFEMEVSIIVQFFIDAEKADSELLNNEVLLREYIEAKKGEFLDRTNVASHLSSCVTQITAWFGNAPLIIPANIEEQEQE